MVSRTDKTNSYLIAIIISLLSLTASGVGYLIVQNNIRLNKHDDRILILENDITDLKNISRNLVETYNSKCKKDEQQDSMLEKQRDEIMELWKSAKRSGGSNSMVLKE